MKSIDTFLAELYAIDPDLREHEEELIPLIKELLAADPAQKPDSHFVNSLRSQLQTRAASLPLAHRSLGEGGSFLSSMQKFLYGLAGAALAAIVIVPAVYYGTKGSPLQTQNSAPLFSYHVTDTKKNAFGDLSTINTTDGGYGRGGGGGGGPVAPVAAPEAAPTNTDLNAASPASADAKIAGGQGGGYAATEPAVINPEYTELHYIFGGKLPELPKDTVSVLKRIKDISRPDAAAILKNFNVGMMDLASFGGSTVDSVTFSQDTNFGYMISIMLREGMVSISQNWEQWPHPEQECRDEACYQRYQVTLEEIPADDALLKIAGDFVQAHGISIQGYSEPEVDKSWKRDYDHTPDKRYAYVPESVPVLYPLIVDGRPVYDQGGGKMGIRVNVSVRQKRVSDIWGMQNQNFLRSDYAVASEADVTSFLENFEKMPAEYRPKDVKVKTIDVILGEPSMGYTVFYDYSKPAGDELIVPSLIFPVENADNNQYIWRQTVSVPLAKELTKQQNPIPIPLDAEKSAR